MWAVIKKEIKSYFYSPVGYVFIGLFLIMFSIFFYTDVFTYQSTNFEYIFYSGATILTFIVPILTMRTFAEERKNGTEQLLLTSPTGMFKVVLGKLLSALLVIVITLLISFIFFFILMYFGSPNIVTTLVSMLGFVLLSLAALSFGVFTSSLTENQVIAGVITVAFLIISLFISDISSKFSGFALMNYYANFAQGVISIENIISLLLFSVVFISLTIIVMQRRKLVK